MNKYNYFLLLLFVFAKWTIAINFSDASYMPAVDNRSAYTPAIAYGNGVFLVCWKSGHLQKGDLRDGVVYKSKLMCARIDTLGVLVDNTPITIADTTDLKESPKVVYGAGQFFVVWHDLRNGIDWDIYGARVGTDGTVIDKNGFLISGGANNQALPRVAWNGTNYSVVWQDARSNRAYEAYMARVSPDGAVLDANGILVLTGAANYLTPVIAASGITGSDSLLVIAANGGGNLITQYPATTLTKGVFASNSGVVGSPSYSHGTNEPTGEVVPILFPLALTRGANSYLLAWNNETPFGRGNTMKSNNMAIFSNEGQRVKNLEIGYYAGDVKRIMNPEVYYDGKNFVAVWHEQGTKTNKDTTHDKACVAVISDTGAIVMAETLVAGKATEPALNVAVAAAPNGVKLIAYEQQPSEVGVPIKIAYKTFNYDNLTAKEDGSISNIQSSELNISPNPFNPTTLITLKNIHSSYRLEIFDARGQRVLDHYGVATNDGGNRATTLTWTPTAKSSSVYLVKMTNGRNVLQKRITLLK